MPEPRPSGSPAAPRGARPDPLIVALAASALLGWLALVALGDLRARPVPFLAVHALLAAVGLAAWLHVRRRPSALGWAVAAAVLFRLVVVAAPVSLSDDVYRYVWDGRVQLHGVHPYALPPDAPELAPLRDAAWSRINHPEIGTIYPPLAQIWFAGLAALGAGVRGFRLAAAVADIAVLGALALLLRRTGAPRDRLILYAWHPLPVLEAGGSGHLEPLGVALALAAAAWLAGGRRIGSTVALAAAALVKLFPLVHVPGHLRRAGPRAAAAGLVALALPVAGYAAWGPAWGEGVGAYAERWEHNATLYALVEGALEWFDTEPALRPAVEALERSPAASRLPTALLHRHVWPRSVARAVVALAALAWVGWVVLRRRPRGLAREQMWVAGGVLLLAPTFHPWYALWVLGWAAACRSWGWLLLGALLPLSYAWPAEVSWAGRALIFGPPLVVAVARRWAGRRRRTSDRSGRQ